MAVDCDVHVAPQTLEPLLAHMDDYWADYVANSELRLSPSMNGTYPPVAFLASMPASVEELRADVRGTAVLNCIATFDTSHNAYYETALCGGVNDWLRS